MIVVIRLRLSFVLFVVMGIIWWSLLGRVKRVLCTRML